MSEKIYKISVEFVKEIPKDKQEGILYISKEYGVAIHLCACGCGEQTVTPIGQIGTRNWTLIENGQLVSLQPSILNSGMKCKSHYFLRENKIVWC